MHIHDTAFLFSIVDCRDNTWKYFRSAQILHQIAAFVQSVSYIKKSETFDHKKWKKGEKDETPSVLGFQWYLLHQKTNTNKPMLLKHFSHTSGLAPGVKWNTLYSGWINQKTALKKLHNLLLVY